MKTRTRADKTTMKALLAALALSASVQAQEPPSIAIIHTGWEKIRHNVYVYYGPETQRSRESVYLTEPIGTVRKTGSYWTYQVSGHAMIPAMSREDAVYALETMIAKRDAAKP